MTAAFFCVFWPFCWRLVWSLDSALAVFPAAAVVVPDLVVVVVVPVVVCVYVVLTVVPHVVGMEVVSEVVLGFSMLMTSGSILVPVLEQYSVKDLVDLQI